MAYNKVSNKTQNRDIKYISKDYSTFKNQLIEFAKVYFPDVHNDFSESKSTRIVQVTHCEYQNHKILPSPIRLLFLRDEDLPFLPPSSSGPSPSANPNLVQYLQYNRSERAKHSRR